MFVMVCERLWIWYATILLLLKPLYRFNTLGCCGPGSEKSRVLPGNVPRVSRVPDLLGIFAQFSHHPFMVNGNFGPRVLETKVADKSWENARIILLGLEKILICSEHQYLLYWARYRANKLRVTCRVLGLG
jgi:hypothetical protein